MSEFIISFIIFLNFVPLQQICQPLFIYLKFKTGFYQRILTPNKILTVSLKSPPTVYNTLKKLF